MEAWSALVDGEVSGGAAGAALDAASAAWRDGTTLRETWRTYHLIGDVLRSEDLAHRADADGAFLARLRESLATEPAVLAPGRASVDAVSQAGGLQRLLWRGRLPRAALAVAGVAAVAGLSSLLWLAAPPHGVQMAVAPAGSADLGDPRFQVVDGGLIRGARLEGYLRGQLEARALRDGSGTRVARAASSAMHGATPAALEAEGWSLSQVPPGFRFMGFVRRDAPAGGGGSPADGRPLQAVFSDGQRQVSVFLEPLVEGQPRRPVLMQAGSTHTLVRPHRERWWVTVMGDVPPETLQEFMGALEPRR